MRYKLIPLLNTSPFLSTHVNQVLELDGLSPINAIAFQIPTQVERPEIVWRPNDAGLGLSQPIPPIDSFGKVLDGLIGNVVAKDDVADAATRSVLLGESGQLHRAMIAGAESDIAFTLMMQVRNKLVESYQELARLPV